jgi:hypothetical protein
MLIYIETWIQLNKNYLLATLAEMNFAFIIKYKKGNLDYSIVKLKDLFRLFI